MACIMIARFSFLTFCYFMSIIAQLETAPMVVGPPACSFMTFPPEFFTCSQRAIGKYADDKRLCRFYWECKEDGSIDHVQCPPPTTVFDDRLQQCVTNGSPENVTCPIDYGGFQSAGSFCRGRPYTRSLEIADGGLEAYYPHRLADCTSYYWCYTANGQSFGHRFECTPGEIFDEATSTCRKPSANVKCNCGNYTDVA